MREKVIPKIIINPLLFGFIDFVLFFQQFFMFFEIFNEIIFLAHFKVVSKMIDSLI